MWPGGSPVYLAEARGARVTDVDGNEYVDFCLGDTGAMAGHSPEPAMAALRERAGITVMLPTEDAEWVGSELARRFGAAVLAVLAHRDRRQPLGAAHAARDHRAAAGCSSSTGATTAASTRRS